MILRDVINLMPADEVTNVSLFYFNHEGDMYCEDLYIRFELDEEPHKEDAEFSLRLAEHFADDEVLEISNRFRSVAITVDRKVKQETVRRWKTQAADAAGLPRILRDWEEDE